MKTKIYFVASFCLILFLLLHAAFLDAQTPPNDECSGAIELWVTPTTNLQCDSLTFSSTAGATESFPACFSTGNDDVWFKFKALSQQHFIQCSATHFEVYDQPCGSNMGCGVRQQELHNLILGQEYYIRVYSYAPNSPTNFNICVLTLPELPPNDSCHNAIEIIPTITPSCTDSIFGDVYGATTTNDLPICTNVNFPAPKDIWYKFTAIATAHTVKVNHFSERNSIIQVLRGNCDSLEEIRCVNDHPYTSTLPEVSIFTNLTPGTTYYLRITGLWSVFGSHVPISVCVFGAPPPPSNDNCQEAQLLDTISDPSDLSNGVTGNTSAATAASDTACSGVSADDDIWYNFEAVQERYIIRLVHASIKNAVMEIYQGNTCDSLSLITCVNDQSDNTDEFFYSDGFVPGAKYFIRVYSYQNQSSHSGTFILTLLPMPSPPSNITCSSAIEVTPSPLVYCPSPLEGSTLLNDLNTVGNPGCYGTDDDGVWFWFVPKSTAHQISIFGGTIDFPYFRVLKGPTCTTLTTVDCAYTNFEKVNSKLFTGLDTNSIYFIKVYSYAASIFSRGDFKICISTPFDSGNGSCTSPITVPVTPDCSSPLWQNNSITVNTPPNPNWCPQVSEDDVWFAFWATQPTHRIEVGGYGTFDAAFQVINNTCDSALSTCVYTPNVPFDQPKTLLISGLTVGQRYLIRVFNVAIGGGTFFICVSNGLVTQNEPNPLNDINIIPNPAQNTITVTWPTEFHPIQISLFNLHGQRVQAHFSPFPAPFMIDVGELPNGCYVFQATDGQQLKTMKIVVQH